MRLRFLQRLFILGVLLPSSPAAAQVVRGVTIEGASRIPQSGVLVELLRWEAGDSAGVSVAATLSDAGGRFALRAGAAGRFILTAKRIGVRRYRSSPFDLAAGETIVRDVAVNAVAHTLPEIVVTGLRSCDAKEIPERVAALWEDARAALFATQLSLRDSLFTAHVTRYVREIEPRSRRILNEYRSEVTGVVSRPFRSSDPESLSAGGYVQAHADGTSTYQGPDAEVLLSKSFLRDHCFREARDRNRAGLVGLAFQPVRDASVADVLGTLWLDAKSSELQFVEFGYNRIPEGASRSQVGGEVHFARLSSGAWIVRRWFIRLPVTARGAPPISTEPGGSSWVLIRPTTLLLREEGGDVAADDLVPLPSATLRGTVSDSMRQPFAGARVRIAGTRLAAETSANGAFVIDSVPVGERLLVVEAAGYDSLGLSAIDARVTVRAGENKAVGLRALDTRALYSRLCVGRRATKYFGALRVLLRGESGTSFVTGLPLSVQWWSPTRTGGDSTLRSLDLRSDSRGSVVVCEVPSGTPIRIVIARPGGGSLPVLATEVPSAGVRGVMITVPHS
jgi:hypothetical protein